MKAHVLRAPAAAALCVALVSGCENSPPHASNVRRNDGTAPTPQQVGAQFVQFVDMARSLGANIAGVSISDYSASCQCGSGVRPTAVPGPRPPPPGEKEAIEHAISVLQMYLNAQATQHPITIESVAPVTR